MRSVLVLALAALALAGCSGKSKKTDCLVNCPPGTTCDKDRCLPVCIPPCGADEYCGADNLCHKGPAPDGGVVVPPLDGGPPKDSAVSDAKSPKDSSVPAPDSDPNKQLCDCLAQQPKSAYCLKQALTCQVASDCCQTQITIPCGTYGNKFACNAGKCERQGCSSAAECVSYAQALQQPSPQDWTCHPPVCAGQLAYCNLKIKSCAQDSDCCNTSSVPCGTYNNHWKCDNGTCTYVGCLNDPECVSYAQGIGATDPATWVCRTVACYSAGYCMPKPKPCAAPSDCCTPNYPVPCGVYSNRYRCESNECVLDSCTGKPDCLGYANALSLPDPDAYNCISY